MVKPRSLRATKVSWSSSSCNLSDARVAGQVEHFEKAAALLKQFDAIRQSAPSLAPGAVLQQISPSDQGMMLQTLLLAAGKAQTPKVLWGVAGPSLVRIDPRATPIKIELFNLPTDLGPLRSTQLAQHDGHSLLLVGARNGVIVAKPDALTELPRLYRDQEISSQLGFQKCVIWQNQSYGPAMGKLRTGCRSKSHPMRQNPFSAPRACSSISRIAACALTF